MDMTALRLVGLNHQNRYVTFELDEMGYRMLVGPQAFRMTDWNALWKMHLEMAPIPVEQAPLVRQGPCMECGALVPTNPYGKALAHRDRRSEAPTEIIWCTGYAEKVAEKGECSVCGQVVGVGCWGKYDTHSRYDGNSARDVPCEGSQQFYVEPKDLPEGLVVARRPKVIHLSANEERTEGMCGATGLSPDVKPGPDDTECTKCLMAALLYLQGRLNTIGEITEHNARVAERSARRWLDDYDSATLRIERLEKALAKIKRVTTGVNLLKRVRRLERKGEAQARATKMIAGGGKP